MPQVLAQLNAIQAPKTYVELRTRVRKRIAEGKLRAQKAVELENVRTAWAVGHLIQAHILHHKDRADYGAKVIVRLSKDVGISVTELNYTREFAKAYPISRPAGKLSWGHHQALLRINDAGKRAMIAAHAEKENWNRAMLRREIRKFKSRGSGLVGKGRKVPVTETLPIPAIGPPFHYRVIQAMEGTYKNKLVVDLGFAIHFRPANLKYREGTIVKVSRTGKVRKGKPAQDAMLYTYRAWVIRVIDGDTIWARIDLGFGITTRQSLRFLHLNAPELNSRAGIESKKYLSRKLKPGKPVLIKTAKSDHFDRYLAEVFIGKSYLNAEIIEKGFAAYRPN